MKRRACRYSASVCALRLLDGFRRVLSAVGFVDLGNRWRRAAFRVGSACETAQKSQTGLASGKGGAANAAKRAGFAGRKG